MNLKLKILNKRKERKKKLILEFYKIVLPGTNCLRLIKMLLKTFFIGLLIKNKKKI